MYTKVNVKWKVTNKTKKKRDKTLKNGIKVMDTRGQTKKEMFKEKINIISMRMINDNSK